MLLNLAMKNTKGIWSISNKDGRTILIATKNIKNYLLQLWYGVDVGSRNIDPLFIKDLNEGSLSLNLVEDVGMEQSLYLNIRLGHHLRQYSNLYSHQKRGTHYKPVVRRVRFNKSWKAAVMLKPSSSAKLEKLFPVGIFDTTAEANDWKNEHYKDEWVSIITYAYNSQTKEYFESL